jgi:protease-4
MRRYLGLTGLILMAFLAGPSSAPVPIGPLRAVAQSAGVTVSSIVEATDQGASSTTEADANSEQEKAVQAKAEVSTAEVSDTDEEAKSGSEKSEQGSAQEDKAEADDAEDDDSADDDSEDDDSADDDSADDGETESDNESADDEDDPQDEESAGAKKVRSVTVVTFGLAGSLSEAVSPPGLFGELQRSLRQTIERLDRAAEDDEVSAVVLRIRNPSIGRGKLHELRQAVTRLRRSGKQVHADLQFATPADYLLACACDRIVMPESGNLFLPGVRAEVMFYKNLFEKLGVQAEMLQVGDYKGAAEPYTRTEMSEAFRRQYELVVDDLYDQMVDMIATDRNLNRDAVKQSVDRGLFSAQQAKDAGLIDLVAYEDESRRELGKSLSADTLRIVRNYGRKQVDTDFSGMSGMFKFFELLSGSTGSKRASRTKKIAVVYAVGAIMPGRSQAGLWGGQTLGSDTIVAALAEAEADESVAGIVLRIDSPGGSALASDMIWRQVRQCKKPVVASMGDIAASGGYYIAMGCDKIVAEPGTLTGSIGVVGGKIAISGLMDKAGLTTDVISRGKNSGLFSSSEPFTDSEREVMRDSMLSVYDQFTRKAAEGRGMDLERLKELAGGRIWTGQQAKQKGLVDELGTLETAVQLSRQLANIADGDEVDLMILPKSKSFIEQLIEGPDAEAESPDLISRLVPHGSQEAAALWQSYQLLQEPFLMWLPYQINIR